jgi:hypothetical protein
MKLIAHRGNLWGPSPNENDPSWIDEAIRWNYDVEIDIRLINGRLFLGHDEPQYEVDMKYLYKIHKRAWIHCKNLEALHFFLKMPEFNCFWHQNDDYTITSHGYIWAFPGKPVTSISIAVMPEISGGLAAISSEAFGVCSDYVAYLTK